MFNLIIVSKETFELLKEQNAQIVTQTIREKEEIHKSYQQIISSQEARIRYLEALNERLLYKTGIIAQEQPHIDASHYNQQTPVSKLFTRQDELDLASRRNYADHLQQVRMEMEEKARSYLSSLNTDVAGNQLSTTE